MDQFICQSSIILQNLQVIQHFASKIITNVTKYQQLEETDRSFKKLQYRFKKNLKRFKVVTKQRRCNSVLDILEVDDILDRTGLFDDRFEELYLTIQRSIQRPYSKHTRIVTHKLSGRMRLLAVLHCLRHNLKFSVIRNIYQISKSTFSRDFRHILPSIYIAVRNQIEWPIDIPATGFYETIGAIDCSSHFRQRPHPGSLEYYRGDYKDYFITAQIVVSLEGILWSVHLGKGHNNDQGMFNITGVASFLSKNNIRLLSDRGYWSRFLVTPRDMPNPIENDKHKFYRSIVERVIGFAKTWAIAADRCRFSPELQQIALFIVYSFVNSYMKEYPIANRK